MPEITKEQIEALLKKNREQAQEIAELKAKNNKVMVCVGDLKEMIEPLLPKDGKAPGVMGIMGIAQKLMQKENQQKLANSILPLIEMYEQHEAGRGA